MAKTSARSRGLTRDEARRKEQVLTQHEPSNVRHTAEAVVVKEGALFLLSTASGDVPWDGDHGLGLFFHDCRFLDGYLLTMDGTPPTVLSADDARGYESFHYLTNRELGRAGGRKVPKSTLVVRRQRVVRSGVLHELTSVRNHGGDDVRVRLEFRYRARFEDVFIVKGFLSGPRGRLREPAVTAPDAVELAYEGKDGLVRMTEIAFVPVPHRLAGDRASFELDLPAGQAREIAVRIAPSEGSEPRPRRPAADPATEPEAIKRWLRHSQRIWLASSTEIRSANPLFDRVVRRALLDLRMLRTGIDGDHFSAAGVPWFATLFGRDAAVIALQTLPYGPRVARQTLELLARYQADTTDEYRDAEPGKILHELRRGELARLGAIPQSPAYYGTVDATMLFVILAEAYVAWSGDLDLVRRLRGNLDRALGWMADFADHDGDGYLDYAGGFAHGLVNQGWKDSGNAVVDADGSFPEPPIALAEVQAYAYRAWRAAARLLRALGEAPAAESLERRAAGLRERFEADFWDDGLGCYILARQRGGRPVAVVTSNAGQVLWGGIASAERAARVAERLLRPDMFSGWGIRTLSSEAVAYNPVSYHCGSVWPHDNALILAGFRRYGLDAAALRVFDAVFEAASRFRSYRLPELYCGHDRAESEDRPVGYPVACSPQGWAAGSIPHALWNLLGLRPDALRRRLDVVRPCLPDWLPWLALDTLTVGDAAIDLTFSRAGGGEVEVNAKVRQGELEVRQTSDAAP